MEHDGHYEITTGIPVITKGNVHISLENDVHRIEAETSQEEKEDKEGKVIHQERRYGKYVRSFDLGNSVHQEDIKAAFEDGILKLTAPKVAEDVTQQRRIDIQ